MQYRDYYDGWRIRIKRGAYVQQIIRAKFFGVEILAIQSFSHSARCPVTRMEAHVPCSTILALLVFNHGFSTINLEMSVRQEISIWVPLILVCEVLFAPCAIAAFDP